jgi:hypothetical protein
MLLQFIDQIIVTCNFSRDKKYQTNYFCYFLYYTTRFPFPRIIKISGTARQKKILD